jgi:hypothetical protein
MARYGLLVRQLDGTHFVWGPKKYDNFALDYGDIAFLRHEDSRDTQYDDHHVKHIAELEKWLGGTIVDVIEILNYQEIRARENGK